MPVPRTARLAASLAALVALAVLCAPGSRADTPASRPLTPEEVRLLERARDNIIADDDAIDRYAYRLERRSYEITFGRVSNGDVRTYEVAPSPFEPGRTWRRLVALNGRPRTPAELRRDEERARAAVEDRRRRESRETPPQRARREAEREKRRREQRELYEDVQRVFRFEALGRETRAGRSVFVVSIIPRPDAVTRSDAGPHMKKWRGRGWVDEAEAQVIEMQMEAFADINLGWGVIGHVDRGATASYRRARLPDGTWLPVEARFRGAGRTLLLIPFQIETWAKYNDYRPLGPAAAGAAGHDRR